MKKVLISGTGKSVPEALILKSVKTQHDERLFVENTSSEHVMYEYCFECKNKQKNNFCTQHVLNLYFSCNSINNLSSYCGLTDPRMRASEKNYLYHLL